MACSGFSAIEVAAVILADMAAAVRLEFVVRPPLGAGPSPGSGRSNGHCSARHGPPCVHRRRSTACGPSTTRGCVPRWRRPDARRHATLPQSWIQRENWEFETHRYSIRAFELSEVGRLLVSLAAGCRNAWDRRSESIDDTLAACAESSEGVVARIVTGPHDANRQDPHRPMRYDTGRPRAVIRLRISQPRTASLPCPAGLRARRPSPMMDLYRKNAFSPALTMVP